MNKKALIVLALALVFGAITAAAVNRVLKRGSSKLAEGEVVRVVVAVSPISVGQRITPDQVKLEERPKTTLPEGTLSDITQVVDHVSLAEVTIGEAVLNSRLAPEGSAAGLSAVIPEGMRAMTVKVDEVIGVAGFVSPGTYVDVVATIVRTSMDGDSASRIILQNVKVLASGKQIENGKDGGSVEVRTVTLQVTPEQAEALALASTAGRLQLVMRNTVDENQINTKGIDTVALFQGLIQNAPRMGVGRPAAETEAAPRPKPARVKEQDKEVVPKPAGATVELIQGAQRTMITFQ
jgi:pilus assembly protein CpaB